MKDKIDLKIIQLDIYLSVLKKDKLDENKTSGEVAAIHQEIYAVELGIEILKELKDEN